MSLPEGEYNSIRSIRDSALPTQHDTAVRWADSCYDAEAYYLSLLAAGWTPQQARTVLPNSLKTEIVMTANFREWRHVFRMRAHPAAHPQMLEIMQPLLRQLRESVPVVFDDVGSL